MTLEVDAQLQQRAKRDHGAAFDRLIRDAREQLNGGMQEPPSAAFRTSNRTEPEISPEKTPQTAPEQPSNDTPDDPETRRFPGLF